MIYILYGSDSLSRTEALRTLRDELDTADGMLESNTAVLDARHVTPQEVFAACDTAPFFGGRRLVILEGALRQSQGAGRRGRKREDPEREGARGPWWALVEYAGRMPEETVLVLVDGDSIDKDMLQALRPLAKVQPFPAPTQRDVAGWVQARARAKGMTIEGRACALLAELVGRDTWMLASELDKLAAYAAGETVGEKDVRALVTDVRDREGFLLADAAADGKAALATKLLHEMLAKGRIPAVLLLTIEQRYRRIAVAREMIECGETARSIAARLRIDKPYPLERLLDQVSRHSPAKVRWALDRIAQADYDVKQGLCEEDLSIELVVQDLAAAGAASRAA